MRRVCTGGSQRERRAAHMRCARAHPSGGLRALYTRALRTSISVGGARTTRRETDECSAARRTRARDAGA
eukprot:3100183-Pleurochrysis_carterae.AAC.1